MDDQSTSNTELTTKRIREDLHLKIAIGVAAALTALIALAVAIKFFWPFIKTLL